MTIYEHILTLTLLSGFVGLAVSGLVHLYISTLKAWRKF